MNFKDIDTVVEKEIGEFKKDGSEIHAENLKKFADSIKLEEMEEYGPKHSQNVLFRDYSAKILAELCEKLKKGQNIDNSLLYQMTFTHNINETQALQIENVVIDLKKQLKQAAYGIEKQIEAKKKEEEIKEKEKNGKSN